MRRRGLLDVLGGIGGAGLGGCLRLDSAEETTTDGFAFWMHRHGAEYFGNVELRA